MSPADCSIELLDGAVRRSDANVLLYAYDPRAPITRPRGKWLWPSCPRAGRCDSP